MTSRTDGTVIISIKYVHLEAVKSTLFHGQTFIKLKFMSQGLNTIENHIQTIVNLMECKITSNN